MGHDYRWILIDRWFTHTDWAANWRVLERSYTNRMCLETSNTICTAALLQVFQVPCHACMYATLPAIAGMQASSKTECKHSPLYCRQASECTIHNGIGTMHASCMLSNSKRSDFERFKTSSSCTYACMQPFFSACRFAVALSSQSNSCHAYATTSDHRVV